MRREVAVAGAAEPELVWERYARIEQWSTWAPFITSVEASGELLAAGLTGVVHGPMGARVSFVVTAADRVARSWTWEVRSGPVSLDLDHEVLARPAGGAVATLTLIGPTPVVLGYLPLALLALGRLTSSQDTLLGSPSG